MKSAHYRMSRLQVLDWNIPGSANELSTCTCMLSFVLSLYPRIVLDIVATYDSDWLAELTFLITLMWVVTLLAPAA